MTTKFIAPRVFAVPSKFAQPEVVAVGLYIVALASFLLLSSLGTSVIAQDDDPFAKTNSAAASAQDDDPFGTSNPAKSAAGNDNPFGSAKATGSSSKLNVLPPINPDLDSSTRLIIDSVRRY